MRAAFVALAAGLCASAAPAFEPRAGLETRAPHGDYTYDDAVTDPIGLTYGPADAQWYHDSTIASAYNSTLSYSNHPNATVSWSFSSGAVAMSVWSGKKADRGSFTVFQDGVQIGTGDAYDASAIEGTAAQQLFTVTGLDTAPRSFSIVNSPFDDRIGATPWLSLDYIVESD